MKFKLRIWGQKSARSEGRLVDYDVEDVSPDTSFLEMLDLLNEKLTLDGEEPVTFDYDCRVGVFAGRAAWWSMAWHTAPRLRLPRANCICVPSRTAIPSLSSHGKPPAFPIVKDLMVDRDAFDCIVQAGGYVSVSTGSAPRCECLASAQENGLLCHGRRCVHRVCGMCCGLSKFVRHALHRSQGSAFELVATGGGGTL